MTLFAFFHGHGFDDPYITYRYSINLARGDGFVYNPGERVLSTTAPLYALALVPAAFAGLDVPLVSVLISCFALASGGLAFWYLGQAWRSRVAGLAGLLVYPVFPLLLPTLGAETALYNGLVLFGFVAYARRHYTVTAMLLGLAALTRADALLAALVVAAHFLLVRRQPVPWRAVLVYCGLLALWFGFAWIYFGAPLPVTLQAKQRQGLLTASRSFGAGLLARARELWDGGWSRSYMVLAAAGLVLGVIRRSPWLLAPLWSALYALVYVGLGVTSYFWYYGPIVPGLVALLGFGVAACHTAASRLAGNVAGNVVTIVMMVLLALPALLALGPVHAQVDPRLRIYREAGEWLRRATPPGASVGALEVGIIGYYADRRMIDFTGLIQPETAQQLTPSTNYEDAALWAFRRYAPDYLVLREGGFVRLEQELLAEGCHVVRRWNEPEYPFGLAVYACGAPAR